MEHDGQNGFKFSARKFQLVTIYNDSIKTAKSLNFEYPVVSEETKSEFLKIRVELENDK